MSVRKVLSSLLQQNCFVRDVLPSVVDDSQNLETYVSLDEVVTSDGVVLRETEHDYPITEKYVQSFAASSDYRADPTAAIANGHSRKNLGDVAGVQGLSRADSAAVAAYYKQLSATFLKAAEAAQVPKEEVKKDEV